MAPANGGKKPKKILYYGAVRRQRRLADEAEVDARLQHGAAREVQAKSKRSYARSITARPAQIAKASAKMSQAEKGRLRV